MLFQSVRKLYPCIYFIRCRRIQFLSIFIIYQIIDNVSVIESFVFNQARVAAVAEWYRYQIVACLVTSSSPVPLKTCRVGQLCTLNLSRAETSSRCVLKNEEFSLKLDFSCGQAVVALWSSSRTCDRSCRVTDWRLDATEDPSCRRVNARFICQVRAYMQMFGSYSQPSESEFFRHSVHTYKVVQANWQQIELSFMQQPSFSTSYSTSTEESSFYDGYTINTSSLKEGEGMSSLNPPSIPPKKNKGNSKSRNSVKSVDLEPVSPSSVQLPIEHVNETPSPSYAEKNYEKTNFVLPTSETENSPEVQGALDELDPTTYLIMKKNGEEGPDLRGGSVDSLIVLATRASKNDFLYQEAFLTTYRTFISPHDLICKLLYRYNKFIHVSDMRQRAARNSFALLVRVVDDLCLTDVHEDVLKILMDFICQLVSRGDLLLARALRKKVVEKCYLKQRSLLNLRILLPSMAVTTHKASLLDFKSESIAEQMTVLDADLFQKIEIPEVLLWAKEQKEELSPNLTTFTEHFNKMSYWARSRILEQEEAKDRERYVVKFIKVMKYLRKLNNFNSYLAILSALDSAPIRRLEWQRNITEGLKEYCALIDSSSSFRAYRQALAETSPPCIPYIGLILQDLTFVHIGNSDMLTEDSINFSKRWQQFNILDNMRRFKNCQYPVKRNEQIISFFNNFDDYLCEEAMWQISETIKPRGGKKKEL
ncbi:guanine nucleotide-releasing factor 2 [Trichonephila clavipes]|nr:guanine nucleotide-releasing factor 2 [Trichonephila clavipes]